MQSQSNSIQAIHARLQSPEHVSATDTASASLFTARSRVQQHFTFKPPSFSGLHSFSSHRWANTIAREKAITYSFSALTGNLSPKFAYGSNIVYQYLKSFSSSRFLIPIKYNALLQTVKYWSCSLEVPRHFLQESWAPNVEGPSDQWYKMHITSGGSIDVVCEGS